MNFYLKRIAFVLSLILIIFIAHHSSVYLHEWTHSTLAWLTNYKSHPFDIHYGEKWITLLDIDDTVPYQKILADGKPFLVASIAIAPTLLQMFVFLMGLKLLRTSTIQNNRWVFAFIYWFTLFELAQVYGYIPIRTFSNSDDIFIFTNTLSLSPWVVAVPGTLFVIWGIYQILAIEEPRACNCLKIFSKSGRIAFLLTTLLIFFGYYGTPGFFKPDTVSQTLTWISWTLVPLLTIIILLRRRI